MKRLKEKYSKYGLVVIQAHSSEYEFANELSNVQEASKYYSIDIPIIFDIGNRVWESYGNTYWPKHILIDQNGLIRYEHAGYGHISEFEDPIIELLEEKGLKLNVEKDVGNPESEIYETFGMHFAGIAPEICVGYSKLRRFGNSQRIKPDCATSVSDTLPHQANLVYIKGKWIWGREGILSLDDSYGKKSSLMMRYDCARRVHAILGKTNDDKSIVEIKLDGNYVSPMCAGKDVVIDNGISYVLIDWSHMYNLILGLKEEIHEIELIPRTGNVIIYTLVFG